MSKRLAVLSPEELRALVREGIRDELGPRRALYAIESKIVEDNESVRAISWENAKADPEMFRSRAEQLGIAQTLGDVLRECRAGGSRVYFIQAGDAGPVKIGISSTVSQRLRDLQISNHEPLALRALIPGGQFVETFFHRRFADDRIRSEWFGVSAELETLMRRLAKIPMWAP